jgi:mRNA interferase HigB
LEDSRPKKADDRKVLIRMEEWRVTGERSERTAGIAGFVSLLGLRSEVPTAGAFERNNNKAAPFGALVKAALDAWYYEVKSAAWSSPAEVKRAYANASIIGSERVVFNIKGNSYRLVAAVDYQRQAVFIKWRGSHADYDRIDVRTVQYGDQTY